jgi:RimJ/RimL family protein N-acetyltransferase
MLRTRRLDLIPATLEHIEAELQGSGAIGRLLEVEVPEGWPPGEYDRDALAFFRARLLAAGPAEQDWYTWYGIARDAQGRRERLVAGAGYFGPPTGGVVEVGYSVVPCARHQGYASEMVLALVDRAFGDASAQAVIAHTTDENRASVGVLQRCGFQRIGPGAEPGTVLFRKERPGAAPMPSPLRNLAIRRLDGQDDLESLTRLIRSAYEPHARSGLRYWATHQSSEDTRRRFSSGIGLIAELEGEYVGTLTLRPPRAEAEVPLYREPGTWSIGQFAVLPRLQGLGIGRRLHEAAIELALQHGGHTLALDTAEPAAALIDKYLGWGYVIVGHHDWRPHTNYRSVLMSRPLVLA